MHRQSCLQRMSVRCGKQAGQGIGKSFCAGNGRWIFGGTSSGKAGISEQTCLSSSSSAQTRCRGFTSIRTECFCRSCRAEKQEVALADTSILWRVENSIELEARQAETARLLLEMGGVHTFWLEGEPVTVRRCSMSVTLREETASLRLDCQRSYDTPQPSAAQCEQLAELCTQTVQSFWQQGIDLVHLQQCSALQNGVGREKITIKNACPQLQADVRFLPM